MISKLMIGMANANTQVMKGFCSKRGSKKGQTLVEYALIIGLIAVAIVAALSLLGVNLDSSFNSSATALFP